MSEKPTREEGQRLLDWIASLDPAWKDRIAALREERHTDPLQTIAILACYTLESGQHMQIPIIEQLLDGFTPAGATAICVVCEKEYTLAYPGQPFCGNDCADTARARPTTPLVPEVVKRKPGRPWVNPPPG
jgi:hypothetical protein